MQAALGPLESSSSWLAGISRLHSVVFDLSLLSVGSVGTLLLLSLPTHCQLAAVAATSFTAITASPL